MSRILHVMSVSRGVDFIGNTVGLAKVSALCSRHSGAVNQVNGTQPILPSCLVAEQSSTESELWGRSVSPGP